MKNIVLVLIVGMFMISVGTASSLQAADTSEAGRILPDSPFYRFDVLYDDFMKSPNEVAVERVHEAIKMAQQEKYDSMDLALGLYQQEIPFASNDTIAAQHQVLMRLREEVPEDASYGINTVLKTSANETEIQNIDQIMKEVKE